MNKKLIFLSISLFCTFSIKARAFIFVQDDEYLSYLKGNRPVAHAPKWPNNTLTFYLNTNLTALGGGAFPATFSVATLQANVNAAIAEWNNLNCKTGIKVVLGGTTSATFDANDDVNVIAYDDRTALSGYCGSASALGCAGPISSRDTLIDCDISINGSSNVGWGTSPSQVDMVSMLVHEMGHCLGLDHTVEPPTFTSTNPYLLKAIMYPGLSNGVQKRVPTQDEKDAMQCIASSVADNVGTPCASYHGSNGGAALTGTVAGGPTHDYTPSCGNDNGEVAMNVQKADTSGCISKAFASPTNKAKWKSSKTWLAQFSEFIFWVSSWIACWAMAMGIIKTLRFVKNHQYGKKNN